MPSLRNRTILIVSPQSWGKMYVSKHHYAIELANYGNKVYFLNPPQTDKKEKMTGKILIRPSGNQDNLFIIDHRISFPYRIKFHFPRLFHALMKPHINAVL